MALADYQITVIHPTTGQTLQVYDGAALISLRYNRALNDVGALVLTLPGDTSLDAVFPLDALVEVARTSPVTGLLTTEDTYFARLTHRFREGNEERCVVGGLSLNHLLSRRVIDPDDDPLAAGGYSTKTGPADEVIYEYAREQAGDLASAPRQFPNFSVSATLSVGRSIGKRVRYTNLLTLCQELAETNGVDFTIQRVTANTLRMVIEPIGSDKTRTTNYPFAPFVLLNPERGNLSDPSLSIDRKQEGNYCYTLGQGQGEARIVLEVSGLGIADSPYNRIEFTKDARNVERGDATQLITEAREALDNKKPKREFSFEPTGQAPGNIYRQDWDIGDKITAAWGTMEIDLRVRDVEIDLSSQGETITVKVQTI